MTRNKLPHQWRPKQPGSTRRAGRERGIALLTMLLIAALATTLVMVIIDRQGRLQRELGAQMQQDQMAEYNKGAAMFAMAALQADLDNGSSVDQPGEYWAQPFPPFPVPGGIIQPTLRDAQARFNLNSLVDGTGAVNQTALAFYQRILSTASLPPELADSLIDWLDPDSQPYSSQGAEDDYYQRQTPSYRTANRPLSTYGELRLVRGYSSAILRALSPLVTVLPISAKTLNVNFISPLLLQAMVAGLSSAAATELLQQRPADGWKSTGDFMNNPVFNSVDPTVKQQVTTLLDVKSSYFELYTRIRFGDRERLQWALISRKGNKLRVIANERNPLWAPDSDAVRAAQARSAN